jgi:4-hydroxy-tetrahydrodipicolinate synthase
MTCDARDLKGVMVALLTPVLESGKVDHGALGELVDSLAGAGVAGISPLGSTGEGASLPLVDRLAVVDTAVAAAGPLPVVPGVFRNSLTEAVQDVAAYAEHGASAALVAPPHYFALTPPETAGFFRALGDDTALPIIMYDIPSFTKNTVSPVVVADLAQHERIIGLKDSTRDLEHLLQLLDALRAAEIEGDQFSIMTGTDTMLLESLQAGASGAIVASANVAAQLSVGIYRSWAAGNLPRATGLERQLRELVAACRVGTFPAGWKAAASALGICRADLVAPRRALGDGDRTELVARLRQSGLLGGLAEAGVGSRNPR